MIHRECLHLTVQTNCPWQGSCKIYWFMFCVGSLTRIWEVYFRHIPYTYTRFTCIFQYPKVWVTVNRVLQRYNTWQKTYIILWRNLRVYFKICKVSICLCFCIGCLTRIWEVYFRHIPYTRFTCIFQYPKVWVKVNLVLQRYKICHCIGKQVTYIILWKYFKNP